MAINDRIRELQNKFVMSNMTHEEQSELLAIAFNLSDSLSSLTIESAASENARSWLPGT